MQRLPFLRMCRRSTCRASRSSDRVNSFGNASTSEVHPAAGNATIMPG